MRFVVFAGIILGLLLVVGASYGDSSKRCTAGDAMAFAAIQDNPGFLVGTIPSSFTEDPRYFTRRYNCRGGSAAIRRVAVGLYQVRFSDLRPRLALATAISDEAVSASVHPFGDVIQVALRGPLAGSDVAARRDVAFSVVVY